MRYGNSRNGFLAPDRCVNVELIDPRAHAVVREIEGEWECAQAGNKVVRLGEYLNECPKVGSFAYHNLTAQYPQPANSGFGIDDGAGNVVMRGSAVLVSLCHSRRSL